MDSQKRFRFRAFVSLLTAFCFVFIFFTGGVLYITPPGRIANWTHWTFAGLGKHQWINLHICFGAVLLIASILHIWLNFKALLSYFINKSKVLAHLRIEWILATIFCGIVAWGALNPFIPFSSLLDLNEHIKFSWVGPQQEPPIPHAEILSMEELAKKSDIELDTLIKKLRVAGIEANASDIFGDIAEQHNLSPDKLFDIATGKQYGGGQEKSGFGQKTLQQACQEIDVNVQKAMDGLEKAGIKAKPDMRIREIADNNGIHPSQIRQVLENL